MAYSVRAKKESLIDALVGGSCPKCASEEIAIKRFFSGTKIYTNLKCTGCGLDDDFQARPEDHLRNQHVF